MYAIIYLKNLKQTKKYLKTTLCFENIISGHCLTVMSLWAHQLYFLSSMIQIMEPRTLLASESTPNTAVNARLESLYGSMGEFLPCIYPQLDMLGAGATCRLAPEGPHLFPWAVSPSPGQDFIWFDFWTFPMLIVIKWTILLVLICISDSCCIRVPVSHGQSSWHMKSTTSISRT